MLQILKILLPIQRLINKPEVTQKAPKPVKKDKDLFQIIEKILVSGSQRIDLEMVKGIISMMNAVASSNSQTTDNEIT